MSLKPRHSDPLEEHRRLLATMDADIAAQWERYLCEAYGVLAIDAVPARVLRAHAEYMRWVEHAEGYVRARLMARELTKRGELSGTRGENA